MNTTRMGIGVTTIVVAVATGSAALGFAVPASAGPFDPPPGNCQPGNFCVHPAQTGLVPPTNAVTMNINVGLGTSDINIASTANIPGNCTYDATAPLLPGVHKTFDLAPNGSTSFSTLSPPLFSTYHVVLSCKGQFDGKPVEFGHVEQDVTAAG